jgi:phenylpropionate dioxygenase-like ring-hydroxylating dioxygenase large terminal subunit
MFLAHVNDLECGFKKPLSQFANKKFLSNVDGDFTMSGNVCPHQGSLIISKKQQDTICQYHSWSWDNKGNPTGSGYTKICNNINLIQQPVYVENNLIFSQPVDLSLIKNIDLSHMKLMDERTDVVNADFRNVVDVFLDVDHIPVVHKGVYDSVGIQGVPEIEWTYYPWGNIQLVSRNIKNKEFDDTLLGIDEERAGACWVTVYPYTMIEWQPGILIVTIANPDNSKSNVSVFKYKDSRYSEENWNINSRVWEEAWMQDKHQAESIVRNLENTANLETSKIHFRKWLAK